MPSKSDVKIVFFGTDEFAEIVLDTLKNAGFNVVMAITKAVPANELNLPPADLGIVAVYGKILPKNILDHFPYGILNIHPSLLPEYRGPSPIRTALFNNDQGTGVTIIRLDEQMDHGDIIAQTDTGISQSETHSELRDRLAHLGADLLIKIIPDYISGKLKPHPQDHSQATYTKLFVRDDGKVDPQKDPPMTIYNKFRAFEGWPGVWFMHKGKRVKILNCKLIDGKLEVIRLQPEGSKPMALKDFMNGHGKLDL